MTTQDSIDRFATARYEIREAREATWARRIAVFFLQLLILTAILHRFAGLGTQAAINLVVVSSVGMAIAVLIALVSLFRIWFGGQAGAAQDFAAIVVGLIGLALPGFFVWQAVSLPPLTDIQTTPADPLPFIALIDERPTDANPLVNPSPEHAVLQAEAYADIAPMYLERSAPEVFAVVNEAVSRLGWNVVTNEAPGESGIGRIEATDDTLVMAFTDDIVVRVKGGDTQAVVDVRSASRYGKHDLGTNADRIRTFYREVNTALEKGEKTVLEQAAEASDEDSVAAPAKDVKKQQRRKPRARRRR